MQGAGISPRLAAQRRAGLVLSAPAATLLVIILLLPSSAVLLLSLTDYTLGEGAPEFVGLASYKAILSDPVFRSSARNTAVFVGLVAPASIGLGLLFALLIEARTILKRWYRTAFFLPVTATFVAMATAWEVLLHPTFGLFNTVLSFAGLEKIRFLSDPAVALFAIAGIGVWKQVGYNMILFLAGIATIPPELYEAASLDGAEQGWRRFLLVTWPSLRPVTLFVVVITLIRALSEFETVAVLTGGGPVHATGVVLFELYEEAFRFLKIGTGSALAVLFLAFVAALSLIQTAVAERRSPNV
jgi:multiple sugar transport system permease protein